METNSHSSHHHSISPFTQDPNNDETPMFLRTELSNLQTIKQASQPFISLVDFIKDRHALNDKATEQACALLKTITPLSLDFSGDEILFKLAPTDDGSCSGFTESILHLLTSSNEKLVSSALSFLNGVVHTANRTTYYHFLETTFFVLLAQSPFEQKLHLFAHPTLDLVSVVQDIMGSFYPDDTRAICRLNHISMDTFKSTFMYKFFNPIEQFLGSVCKNRRQLKDSLDSPWFAGIFESILNFSPFLEETTQTVLSSPLALTFSDSLTFINNKKTSNKYFKVLFNMFAFWRNAVPAVQKRQQQLLAQMIAEGLSDESELFIRCEKYRRFSSTRLFVGAKLIHTLGGNVPFKTEVIRIWL